ncbi:hypothetical protein ACC702_38575, partial [Rhizobium ruizarguesonis]
PWTPQVSRIMPLSIAIRRTRLANSALGSPVVRFLAPITIQDEVLGEALDILEASMLEESAGI